MAGERLLGQAAHRDPQSFFPHGALGLGVDEEAAQLGLRRGLPAAEVDPAVRDQVQHRDALRDPGRMVEQRRGLDDAVPEPHPFGALRHRREEDLGRARVRVLLEEVVLDLPAVLDAEPVGELALLEGVAEQLVLGLGTPRPRQLVLVEDAELHGDEG